MKNKENNMRRKIIAIVGDNRIEKNSVAYNMAFETGKMLVRWTRWYYGGSFQRSICFKKV